jgi:hypothetical protein
MVLFASNCCIRKGIEMDQGKELSRQVRVRRTSTCSEELTCGEAGWSCVEMREVSALSGGQEHEVEIESAYKPGTAADYHCMRDLCQRRSIDSGKLDLRSGRRRLDEPG